MQVNPEENEEKSPDDEILKKEKSRFSDYGGKFLIDGSNSDCQFQLTFSSNFFSEVFKLLQVLPMLFLKLIIFF